MKSSLNVKYNISLAIVLIATLWSCISTPLPEKWDKDYYSYHVGAYVNGVEYHEPQKYQTTIFAKSHTVGFHYVKRDNWFYFSQVDPLYLSSSPDGKGVSIWTITASFDSESYDPKKQYSFTTDNLNDYDEWFVDTIGGRLYDGNKQEIDAPWCLCLISYKDKDYVSKDGWISFGEFKSGSNAETAVRESGQI